MTKNTTSYMLGGQNDPQGILSWIALKNIGFY